MIPSLCHHNCGQLLFDQILSADSSSNSKSITNSPFRTLPSSGYRLHSSSELETIRPVCPKLRQEPSHNSLGISTYLVAFTSWVLLNGHMALMRTLLGRRTRKGGRTISEGWQTILSGHNELVEKFGRPGSFYAVWDWA
jgi:hypothetical protein